MKYVIQKKQQRLLLIGFLTAVVIVGCFFTLYFSKNVRKQEEKLDVQDNSLNELRSLIASAEVNVPEGQKAGLLLTKANVEISNDKGDITKAKDLIAEAEKLINNQDELQLLQLYIATAKIAAIEKNYNQSAEFVKKVVSLKIVTDNPTELAGWNSKLQSLQTGENPFTNSLAGSSDES
jgi:hypothetical protein